MTAWAPSPGLAGRWILACMAGLAIGAACAVAWSMTVLPNLMEPGGRGGMLTTAAQAMAGAILGACLGAAQSLALRRGYPGLNVVAWIGVSAAAGFASALLGAMVYGTLVRFLAGGLSLTLFIILNSAVRAVLAGGLFGLAQGAVLDRVATGRAAWLRFTMLGWLLGAAFGSLRLLLMPLGQDMNMLILGAVAAAALEGLGLGLMTARAFRVMPPRTAP